MEADDLSARRNWPDICVVLRDSGSLTFLNVTSLGV
jgi:hypothetical protein